jgi:T4 RnlA family RNA ligase
MYPQFHHPHYEFNADNLFYDLMALCEGDVFYFQDHVYEGDVYRIFNYRLANYGDFCNDHAIECRGHTFLIPGDGWKPILVSLPMEKFFNLEENPFVMGLDLSRVVRVEEKRDGSLISTVVIRNGNSDTVHVKSKGSFTSEQAKAAYQMLNTGDEYWDFAKLVRSLVGSNYTVNMEYTAPSNQIVVGYRKAELKVLNIRHNETGGYLDPINAGFPSYWVAEWQEPKVTQDWVDKARTETHCEGYVMYFSNGLKVKLKNDWYVALHRSKDEANNPRRLFETVLEEASDDLRTLFVGDSVMLEKIGAMEELVSREYNKLHKLVTTFHFCYGQLDRKSYAIKAQEELTKEGVMSLGMNLYLTGSFDLKAFMVKNYKRFIGDVPDVVEISVE